MRICFAIDSKMIEKYGMVERFQEAGTFNWNLSLDTFYGHIMTDNPGDILNTFEDTNMEKPYAICKAVVEDKDIINGFRAALVGDTVKDINAKIIETTWIK